EGPGRGGRADADTDQPGQGALPGQRLHQGRSPRLLPAGGAGPAAAHRGPAADPQALPRRGGRRGLLPEACHRAPPGLDPDRHGRVGQLPGPRHHRHLPGRGRPARADLGGQPGRPRVARADVAGAPCARARPAGLRPGPGRPGQRGRLLPGGRGAAPHAGGGRPDAAGQDLRRQGPAAVRGDLRGDLRRGQQPGQGLRRTTRARAAPPRGVPDDQVAAHRQGAHRLEPEQRLQDHRRPLLAARPPVPHRLHPRHLGRGRSLPPAPRPVLHRPRHPRPRNRPRRPLRPPPVPVALPPFGSMCRWARRTRRPPYRPALTAVSGALTPETAVKSTQPQSLRAQLPSTGRSASSTAGSSIVDGTGSSVPSAIPRMVLRKILPDLVLGRAATTSTRRSAATAPMRSRTSWTSSADTVADSVLIPALSTTNPRGTWPLVASLTPITAHSATAGWLASTSSICPVDSRCPATLITSSTRPITYTYPSASRYPPSPVV